MVEHLKIGREERIDFIKMTWLAGFNHREPH